MLKGASERYLYAGGVSSVPEHLVYLELQNHKRSNKLCWQK
jgi:hypothetical protein